MWTVFHWQRTSAIQCCPHQPLVDQMIPIYFKEPSATGVAVKERASQIFVHNEALKYTHSKDRLCEITRKDPSIGNRRGSDADALPYIAILADRPSWR